MILSISQIHKTHLVQGRSGPPWYHPDLPAWPVHSVALLVRLLNSGATFNRRHCGELATCGSLLCPARGRFASVEM